MLNKNAIHKLLKRLNAHRKSIVLLQVGKNVPKDQVKEILDGVQSYITEGTLCVIGDCDFNTGKSNVERLKHLSKREKQVLAFDDALSLLSLRHDCRLVKHPSLAMGVVGYYARYLTRHQDYDFPYGNPSVFNDLYELEAIYLTVGEVERPYGLKYAYLNQKEVISRNVLVDHKDSVSYLDFLCNFKRLSDLQSLLCLYEDGDVRIYGERYPWIIDQIRGEI